MPCKTCGKKKWRLEDGSYEFVSIYALNGNCWSCFELWFNLREIILSNSY